MFFTLAQIRHPKVFSSCTTLSAPQHLLVTSLLTGAGASLVEAENGSQDGDVEHEEFNPATVTFFRGKWADAIAGLSDQLRQMPENVLYDLVDPEAIEWALRQRVTDLIKQARASKQEHITTTSVYEGIVSRQGFFETYLCNPLKVAWIVRPVIEHTNYYDAIHKLALKKLLAILKDLPNDSKYVQQILRLAETAANRVHGPVVQRMQIQSKNVNIEVPGNAQGQPLIPGDDPAAIQRQIEQLQQKLLTSAKDVTPKDES